MFRLLWLISGLARRLLYSRRDLLLGNLVLRQYLLVLKRRHLRSRVPAIDKLFWVWTRRIWSGWKGSLILVSPETVVRWRRAGFQLYWRLISKANKPAGRNRISREVRVLIFRIVAENPTWGARVVDAGLCDVSSERTISRWMRRAPKDPERANRWLAFLLNHREVIAAMDFFTVATFTFGALYSFFVIGHDRRCALHCTVSAKTGSCHSACGLGPSPSTQTGIDHASRVQIRPRTLSSRCQITFWRTTGLI
jgi:hypothetical protein